MITALSWNAALVDERSDQPMLIALVATLAVWATAFLVALC